MIQVYNKSNSKRSDWTHLSIKTSFHSHYCIYEIVIFCNLEHCRENSLPIRHQQN